MSWSLECMLCLPGSWGSSATTTSTPKWMVARVTPATM